MAVQFLTLFDGIETEEIRNTANPVITGISYDSRKVNKNFIFFAEKGFHVDGHRYIDEAIDRGSVAVVHSERLQHYNDKTIYIRVKDVRRTLSKVAAKFHGNPSGKLHVIGITGTDGKSTTVWFTHQLLSMLGKKSGFISTVQFLTENTLKKNSLRQSTPESPDIHEMLARMVQTGKQYAVLEATSHGLSEKTARLLDVNFNTAVITNITHEHLEFHGSFTQYLYDKANLFRMSKETGIINLDDPNYEYLVRVSKQKDLRLLYYSIVNSKADALATNIMSTLNETEFNLVSKGFCKKINLNLGGDFNVLNAMAALLAVSAATGTAVEEIAPLLDSLTGLPGRMERINRGQPFNVIVDYAHTPESFNRVFPLFQKYTSGRLISVFGSAGERDIEKRPIQGKIAGKYSDILILADEDPRGENSMKILKDIASGIDGEKEIYLIPDRREAIYHAFKLAKKGDTVVLLGKGHEESIIYDGYSIYWNESKIANKILEEMKYGD